MGAKENAKRKFAIRKSLLMNTNMRIMKAFLICAIASFVYIAHADEQLLQGTVSVAYNEADGVVKLNGNAVASEATAYVTIGEESRLVAVPAAGKAFVRWHGVATEVAYSPTLKFIGKDKSVKAQFTDEIRYVSRTGNDENDGKSWATAMATPHAALESLSQANATTGVVFLAQGEYASDTSIKLDKAYQLRGTAHTGALDAPDVDLYDLNYANVTLRYTKATYGVVVGVMHSGALVSGCTITGGITGDYADHKLFGLSSNTGGGGVFMTSGTVSDCRITGNVGNGRRNRGGGAYMRGNSFIARCLIDHNQLSLSESSSCGGGVYKASAAILSSCVIVNNEAHHGGGVMCDTGTTIRNCTVAENKANTIGGGIYAYQHNNGTTAHNCIFALNHDSDSSSATAPECYGKLGKFSYNLLGTAAGTAGSNCKLGDPKFANTQSGDWRLGPDSPAIYAGTVIDSDLLDFNGNLLTADGKTVSLGAIAHNPNDAICIFQCDRKEAFIGEEFTLTANSMGIGADSAVQYNWTIVSKVDSSSVQLTGKTVTFVPQQYGFYSVILNAVGSSSAECQIEDFIKAYPTVCYVTSDKSFTGACAPYLTPETAATNLLDVIGLIGDGTRISLDAGTHTVTQQVKLVTRTYMHGATDNYNDTVVKLAGFASNYYGAVLSVSAKGSIIENITFTGGRAAAEASANCVVIGSFGGTLRNCRITSSIWNGKNAIKGAISCQSADGKIERCIVDNNSLPHQSWGAGIYITAGIVENCLVYNNETKGISKGSGIYSTGGTVRNCTVVGNRTNVSAKGIYVENQSAKIINCISASNNVNDWGVSNAAYADAFVNCVFDYDTFGTPEWSESSLPNSTCIGCSDVSMKNPAGNDYRLNRNSPARDAGLLDPTWMMTAKDLDGNRRVFDGKHVDCGCYESQYVNGFSIIVR